MRFLIACIFTVLGFVSSAGAQPTKLKIGVIMPLSGEAATFAAPLRRGLELGLKWLPADLQSQVELKFEDDGLDPKRSVSAFQLQAASGVSAVVNFSSGTAHAIAPLAEKAEIPVLAIASDRNVVKNRRYSFLHWVTAEEEAGVAALELKRLGRESLAIVAGEHPGTIAIQDALKAAFGESKVILSETFVGDIRDFRAVIAKIQRLNPAAVSVILFPGQCAAFAKQLRQSGYKGDLFGFEVMADAGEVKAAGGALNNIWYVDATDGSAEFIESFRKEYGAEAGTYAAANGYDIVKILAGAWAAGKRSGSEIANHLETLKDFNGALGTYSASSDHRFMLGATVKRTEGLLAH